MAKKRNCPFNRFTSALGRFFKDPRPALRWFFFSFIWLGVLMFIIDIVTKQIVKNTMSVGQEIVWIPNFLSIHYVQNSGMAFGIELNDSTANAIFFIIVSIIGAAVLIGITIKYWKKLKALPRAALMLMISGTIGNLIDRAFYVEADGKTHFVVDWIGFFGNPGFARFNIADACLTVGALILIVYLIVIEIIEETKKKKMTTEAKLADDETVVDIKNDPEDEEKPGNEQ